MNYNLNVTFYFIRRIVIILKSHLAATQMTQNNPNLQHILEIWQGEECSLRVLGPKIHLKWHNQHQNDSFDHLLSKGIGVFSNIINSHSRKFRKNSFNNSQWNPKENIRPQNRMVRERPKTSLESEFVINPRSKSPLRLNQLAEKYKVEMGSQFGRRKKVESGQYSTLNKAKNKYDFKFPIKNYATQVHENQSPHQIRPPHEHNYSNEREQESNFQSIMESIKEIKLPDMRKSGCTKEYREANHKFEEMKKEILDKIVNDDIQFELTEILAEIQEAADQIIMKHKVGDLPELKRNGTFSFKDAMVDPNFSAKKISQKQMEEDHLIQIDQISEDNSNMIKLAPFKDEAGSISSIASDFGHRKQDEDSGKIEHIFIVNAENSPFGKNPQHHSISLKECKIEEQLPSKLKLQSHINSEKQGSAIKQSLKPQPSQPTFDGEGKNCEGKQKVDVLPLTSNFGEENSVMGSRRKTSSTTYLPYNPSSPIKIAKNLDEAKQIDPEVIKFTEYKLKFLEPKTHQSKVITFTSPLKFRRKEEVVKHLVANNIVDKQSDSIEYPI